MLGCDGAIAVSGEKELVEISDGVDAGLYVSSRNIK